MKLNTLVKKLFVIVAFGGFCMSTQAMWQGALASGKNFVFGLLPVSQPRTLSLAECLNDEKFFTISPSLAGKGSKESIFERCLEKVNRNVDGKDARGFTALTYALLYEDALTAYSLLRLGADSDGYNQKVLAMLLGNVIFKKDTGYVYCELVIKLLRSRFMTQVAQECKHQIINKDPLYAYVRTMEVPDNADDLENNVKKYALSLGGMTVFGSPLAKMFLLMLCLRDFEAVERFVPLIVKEPVLMQMFEENIEKFSCQEYKEEIGRMFVAAKNKHVMHGILEHKKLGDVQLHFA